VKGLLDSLVAIRITLSDEEIINYIFTHYKKSCHGDEFEMVVDAPSLTIFVLSVVHLKTFFLVFEAIKHHEIVKSIVHGGPEHGA
jgi:hypothetical protein